VSGHRSQGRQGGQGIGPTGDVMFVNLAQVPRRRSPSPSNAGKNRVLQSAQIGGGTRNRLGTTIRSTPNGGVVDALEKYSELDLAVPMPQSLVPR
jgi:hypothetical protein